MSDHNSKSTKSSQLSQLYTLFPSLVCQNQSCTKLALLRKVGTLSLIVRVVCPNFPSSKGSKINGDENTLFLLDKSKAGITAAIDGSDTVVEMLSKVDLLLSEIESNNPKLGVPESLEVASSSSLILTELKRRA